MEKPKISFDEFMGISDKLQINMGLIIGTERIPNKDKLLKLTVDFGSKLGIKTCVTNLGGIIYDEECFD